ncbi:RagB/SusD family nutrient uptake outer membrane protein [Marinifilum sp.]|uniref:RagB/SusD family nutrient uptake outer membrane protein n=1 Tax=Marinifilum sp. TaxID=2033137 RepID=UPI003BAADB46
MKNTFIILLFILSQLFIACDEWLDIQPKQDVDLEEQISTANGIFESLTGVYTTMVGENLYGQDLSYGLIEVAAQNHYPNTPRPFADFNWTEIEAKNQIDDIWLAIYNAVANNNIILDNIDAVKNQFAADDYNLVKGEALAIRAFLHFDALRLFGEKYAEDTKGNKQIPYVVSFDLKRSPHLSMDSVYSHIIKDLDEAEALFLESDPIVGAYDGYYFDTDNRKYRFNYYAVRALKARVYMAKGDKENARFYAEKVIEEFNWQWVSQSNLVGSNIGERDLLFFDEVIASLNVRSLNTFYEDNFSSSSVGYTAFGSGTNYGEFIFEVSIPGPYPWNPTTPSIGINDYRYQYLFKANDDGALAVSIKYNQYVNEYSTRYQEYMAIPLFRVSEMMLIAAESYLGVDNNKAITLINDLRDHRSVLPEDLSGKTEAELLEIIVKEFRKETYLEGQLFYMYKRLGLTSIPQMNSWDPLKTVDPDSYVIPLPDVEIEYGNL